MVQWVESLDDPWELASLAGRELPPKGGPLNSTSVYLLPSPPINKQAKGWERKEFQGIAVSQE